MKIHDLKPCSGRRPPAVASVVASAARAARPPAVAPRDRAPATTSHAFEGGQTPLHRRTPKAKGFKNPFRVEYVVVNLDTLESLDAVDEVDPGVLRSRRLVAKRGLVKILGRGELTKALTVRAHAFSQGAISAIEGAGGRVEVIPAPWGDGRPPARGNALTNR